jgi:hypothetical protein
MHNPGPLLSIVLLSAAQAAVASTCSIQSPAHRVALVELYTSQGCSSCPPADRWLSALPQRYQATEAIPLSLHVGYWDYIGWKDPYAKREFNDRQRDWATANQNRTVYTPGVFVHGHEVRDWPTRSAVDRHVKSTNAMPAGASIRMAGRFDGQQLLMDVSAQPAPTAAASAGAELRVALVQSGLSTAVRAGENRGETLGNDHVVREWSAALPLGQHRLTYSLPAGASPGSWAVVAFVQNGGGRQVLQAVRWTAQSCKG